MDHSRGPTLNEVFSHWLRPFQATVFNAPQMQTHQYEKIREIVCCGLGHKSGEGWVGGPHTTFRKALDLVRYRVYGEKTGWQWVWFFQRVFRKYTIWHTGSDSLASGVSQTRVMLRIRLWQHTNNDNSDTLDFQLWTREGSSTQNTRAFLCFKHGHISHVGKSSFTRFFSLRHSTSSSLSPYI